MPRAKTTKLYRTFVKGLITEASPLTYPEDASIAEDNCVIFRNGNRSRRFGMDFESNHQLVGPVLPQVAIDDYAIQEFSWLSAANDADTNFLVLQTGGLVQFFDMASEPLSANLKPFAINLNDYLSPLADSIESTRSEVSFASGKGYLFIVGQFIEPLLVTYSKTLDTIFVSRIYIQIRDFKGVADGLANDEEPATLSNLHHYNLRNQGWLDPTNVGGGGTVTYYDPYGGIGTYAAPASGPITQYFTEFNRYPGNNKQWWIAKSTSEDVGPPVVEVGDFDPKLLSKFYFGNNLAPRGHYVVEAFKIDRTAVSGVADIPVESTTERPTCVTFFAGRVWYAMNSTVYFSQVMDDKGKAGFCYQEADPTAEDISDLIATDGGVIPILEMDKVTRLVPAGSGVIVFGSNGIWFISGADSGFTATDISVAKISAIGTESPNSIVEADGQIFWWSKIGIQAMTQKTGLFGPIEGSFDKTNISEQTIQSFYNNDISDLSKRYVKGIYDPATNIVQWLFKSPSTTKKYMYDRILNLDLTLQAFYPWTISTAQDFPFISGVFLTPRLNSISTANPVVVNGIQVQASGVDVITGQFRTEIKNTFMKYICLVPAGDTDFKHTFGFFNNTNFADWAIFDPGPGLPYNSFVETGYELLEDAMRKKQAQYIFTYFRRTENGFVSNGDGDFVLDRPSSCLLQVKWDWASSQISNKWSTKIEAYRHTRFPTFSEANLDFDTGFPIVITRNKVRGSGRAIQFRFENDKIGYDFDILGWAAPYSGNTEV